MPVLDNRTGRWYPRLPMRNAVVMAIAVAGALLLGCSRGSGPSKVIDLGLGGLEPDAVDLLLSENKLPILDRPRPQQYKFPNGSERSPDGTKWNPGFISTPYMDIRTAIPGLRPSAFIRATLAGALYQQMI